MWKYLFPFSNKHSGGASYKLHECSPDTRLLREHRAPQDRSGHCPITRIAQTRLQLLQRPARGGEEGCWKRRARLGGSGKSTGLGCHLVFTWGITASSEPRQRVCGWGSPALYLRGHLALKTTLPFQHLGSPLVNRLVWVRWCSESACGLVSPGDPGLGTLGWGSGLWVQPVSQAAWE